MPDGSVFDLPGPPVVGLRIKQRAALGIILGRADTVADIAMDLKGNVNHFPDYTPRE